MKNYKRADRRYKKWIKFKRRVDIYLLYCSRWRLSEKEELREEIYAGQKQQWLRTTGKPCSCECCSPSYKRIVKSKLLKDIYKQIEDND